ncbi:MAG: diaminopimelate decarboxylase [Methanotrichaceae archaeon]
MFGPKSHLTAHNGHLFIEGADCVDLGRKFGTPQYITSEARLRENIRAYHSAFPKADKYFAVKANGNLTILRILSQEGMGADVFSAGELYVARVAGIPKEKILFNGNSKSEQDHKAALDSGVKISVDSREELVCLSKTAQKVDRQAEILFRINPDVSPKTHPKIATGLRTSKFGIPSEQVADTYRKAMELPGVQPIGLHCHIGSQILDISPFVEAVTRMMDVAAEVVDLGGEVKVIDIGGGLGIQYHPDTPAPKPVNLALGVLPIFEDSCADLGINPKLILEPGRSIVADTTIMITSVNVIKQAHINFVAVDAGFNTLARPMLYDAHHHVVVANKAGYDGTETYTIVGPICETGDILAKERKLPKVERGDLLAFFDAGAYGFSMASQYNGQPRPAEVLVSGGDAELIRRAEDYSALLLGQRVPPRLL